MVVMGRICAPYGLKGWIKVQPFTQELAGLLDYPEWWVSEEGRWRQHRILESAVHGTTVLARLESCSDRNAAAALKGRDIAIPRGYMPENGEGEFYFSDLLGMQVALRNEATLGCVTKILETGANVVLVVQGPKETLVPFIEGVVVDVNLKARQVTVDWEPI
jgi:16S rRNA processing protein RimM